MHSRLITINTQLCANKVWPSAPGCDAVCIGCFCPCLSAFSSVCVQLSSQIVSTSLWRPQTLNPGLSRACTVKSVKHSEMACTLYCWYGYGWNLKIACISDEENATSFAALVSCLLEMLPMSTYQKWHYYCCGTAYGQLSFWECNTCVVRINQWDAAI